MRGEELVFFGWPDLAGLMRGRAFPVADLDQRLETGIGWVPVAQAISPLSTLAPSPWGALGDVWLAPDRSAGARVDLWPEQPPFHAYICDGIAPDGTAWEACLRAFLRRALADLERTFGLRLMVAFEQEFYLVEGLERPGPNYSIIAHEQALGFGAVLIAALRAAGLEPETFEPEGGPGQYEVNCRPALGLAAADRALMVRELVRAVAGREGYRASFTPMIAAQGFGNGVHVHFSLQDLTGTPVSHDPSQPAGVAAQAGSFVAGIMRRLPALTAFTAPSPVSYLRLAPGHWAGGAAAFGADNREAAIRICAGRHGPGGIDARQYNFEFRSADAAASPHLTLAVLVHAGLEGLREGLPTPPLIERDPSDLTDAEREALDVRWLPRSLEEALAAAEADDEVRGWFPDALWQAYGSLKRHELAAVAEQSPDAVIRSYLDAY